MATVYLIVALVIALLAVVFALQNAMTITISFLAWTITGSLSLVLLVTLVIGVVIGLLVLAPSAVKNSFAVSNHLKRIGALEKELDAHKAKIAELQKPNPVELPSETPGPQQ
ncbi:MAG: lipopolysaccharide assembly protein LapA domain-containing protein [Chloroflexi bacterium]|nr:lipopolysaccharide assembly protein LapA domain-containing protein [Chloroflexota bacterium]